MFAILGPYKYAVMGALALVIVSAIGAGSLEISHIIHENAALAEKLAAAKVLKEAQDAAIEIMRKQADEQATRLKDMQAALDIVNDDAQKASAELADLKAKLDAPVIERAEDGTVTEHSEKSVAGGYNIVVGRMRDATKRDYRGGGVAGPGKPRPSR